MRRERQSGFALLLVFLMAAAIAISLYLQIPRVAFQAQRQKEQLLIERGEQYKRAIQLFYKANNRYPAEIKDLENFNNRRFLRHRFLDPMTGKDDWRLVHINNGVLTDSILTKKKTGDANQPASTAGQYVGEQAGIGQTLPSAQPAQNLAVSRRRPSEGGAPLPAIGPDGQPLPPGQYPVDPTQPAAGQPYPGAVPGQPLAPGQAFGQPYAPGQPQPYPGGAPPVPGAPGQVYPGVQAQPYPVAPVSPDGQPLPGNLANAQATAGTPIPPEVANLPGVGNVPGQPQFRALPVPGQIPGMNTPGGQPNPSSPPQSYVGGSQPYVGSSQPYVGGGAYIGSQPATTPTSVIPPPYTPGVNPAPFPPPSSGPFNPAGVAAPVQPPSNPVMNPVPQGFPATPGGPGLGAAGGPQPGPGAGNPGANFINNILTTPRPASAGAQPQGQQIGGGIAGVASKAESPSIMVYNDRTKYDEWEFIFDPTKVPPVPNPNASTIGTPAQNLGSSPGTPGFGTSPTAPGFGMGRGGPGLGTPGAAGALGAGAPVTAGSPNPGQPGALTGQTSQLPPNIRPGRP